MMSRCPVQARAAPRNFWHYNNLGVQFLSHDDYAQAFQCFRSALALCTSTNTTSQPSMEEGLTMMEEEGDDNDDDYLLDAVATTPTSPSCSATMLGNSHSAMTIHTRGIPIVAVVKQQHQKQQQHNFFFSSDPKQDQQVCTAIIMFNLGLIFHVQALQNNKSQDNEGHLNKAFTLYQQASKVLYGTTGGLQLKSATGHVVIDLLILALTNNKADLCLVLFQNDHNDDNMSSKKLFQRLIQFALSIRESSSELYEESQLAIPMKKQVDSFLFNATLSRILPMKKLSGAAAA